MDHLAINLTESTSGASTEAPQSASFDFFASMVAAVENSRRRQQTGMQLSQVEAHVMHDDGISEAQRYPQVNKPFE